MSLFDSFTTFVNINFINIKCHLFLMAEWPFKSAPHCWGPSSHRDDTTLGRLCPPELIQMIRVWIQGLECWAFYCVLNVSVSNREESMSHAIALLSIKRPNLHSEESLHVSSIPLYGPRSCPCPPVLVSAACSEQERRADCKPCASHPRRLAELCALAPLWPVHRLSSIFLWSVSRNKVKKK